MSQNKLSLSKPIENVSVYQSSLLNDDITPKSQDFATVIDSAFKEAKFNSKTETAKTTTEDINYATASQLETFGSKLVEGFQADKLLNKGEVKRINVLDWKDVSNDPKHPNPNPKTYASFIAEDGLHMIGITAKTETKNLRKKDEPDKYKAENVLVKKYLNKKNKTIG